MAQAEEYIAELSTIDPAKIEHSLRGLASMGEESIGQIMSRLETEGDSSTRVNLMRAIGRVGFENDFFDPSVVERLRELRKDKGLGDGSEQKALYERATYVKVLGMIGEPGCFDELLQDFDHQDHRVRANALEGVAFIIKRWQVTGGVKVQEAIEKAMKDENTRVSVTATVALFLVHTIAAETLKARVRDLSYSNDPAVKNAARRASKSFDVSTDRFLDLFARDSIYSLIRRFDELG